MDKCSKECDADLEVEALVAEALKKSNNKGKGKPRIVGTEKAKVESNAALSTGPIAADGGDTACADRVRRIVKLHPGMAAYFDSLPHAALGGLEVLAQLESKLVEILVEGNG